MKNVLLEWALYYARLGWPVMPLHTPDQRGFCSCRDGPQCHSAGKHPRWHRKLIPHGLKNASIDPEIIKKWWTQWPDANIGVATGKRSFIALDVDLKGDGPETLRDLIQQNGPLPDTCEQITGSGGRQIFFRHTTGILNRVKFADGLDTRSDEGLVVMPPSLHPSGNKYEWEASSRPDVCKLQPMPDWLVDLILSCGMSHSGNGSGVDVAKLFEGIPEGSRDQEIFKYACSLRAKKVGKVEATVLVKEVARHCKPPFPEKDAITKVEQAYKYPEGTHLEETFETFDTEETYETTETLKPLKPRETNLKPTCNQTETFDTKSRNLPHESMISKIESWLELCDGVFTLRELARELQFSSNIALYNNLKLTLKRLKDKKVIESVGSNRGVYRKVERTLERMDLNAVESDEYEIDLPLGLSDLVKIYPKNIIIVAGEKNTAKTLFGLYTAKANMDHKAIHYFNSEMDAIELKSRLLLFDDVGFESWNKVNFYSRSNNFHDCLFPDDVNIIDYMEIHDDYYRIGGMIRQVHDALGKGIAIINIQKKSGQDMGRGGEVTSEKARLYISLSQLTDHLGYPITRAKIVKCKVPRDFRRHPHGWVRDFRIHRGWDIEPIGEWGPEKK